MILLFLYPMCVNIYHFIFHRLGEGLKSGNRLQALTLLGHVVKRQPTWLVKITNHYLLKELLKILKVRTITTLYFMN